MNELFRESREYSTMHSNGNFSKRKKFAISSLPFVDGEENVEI